MQRTLHTLLRSYHEKGWFNGTALVSHQGKLLLKEGYGWANMEWDLPNTTDTKFRIGSLTKQFTSMLIMQLVSQSKLGLDEKLATLLPYYRQDTGNKIVLHELLNHTSGIPSFTSRPDVADLCNYNPLTVEEFVKTYCSDDLEFEPGSQFLYNNSGYYILGAILEHVTGKSYESLLKDNILTPVGMKDTGYDHTATLLSKRAAGYETALNGLKNTSYLDMTIPYASGGMYSTVEDLYLWHQALQGYDLLDTVSKEQMFSPGLGSYAYGWGVRRAPAKKLGVFYSERDISADDESLTIHTHQGGINGFHTLILRVVEYDTLVVLLNNTGGTILDSMTENILSVLYDGGVKPVLFPGAKAVYEQLKRGEDSALLYAELMKQGRHDLGLQQVTLLGRHFLNTKKVNEILPLLKAATQDHPESAQLYDLVAQCLLKLNQKDEAVKYWAQALLIEPGNKEVIKRLAKLAQ